MRQHPRAGRLRRFRSTGFFDRHDRRAARRPALCFLRGREKVTARLLSVNVGVPRDIAWKGKTVHTAVWKAPVQGPRLVRRLNIDGDGQGGLVGHGETIC